MTKEAPAAARTPAQKRVRERIKKWFAASSLNQVEFGQLIGKHQIWVSRYFDAQRALDLDTLSKMVEVFNETLDHAVHGEAPRAVPDAQEGPLHPQTAELLDRWRSLRPEYRQVVLDLMAGLHGEPPADSSHTRGRHR